MYRICFTLSLCGLLFSCPRLDGQQPKNDARNRQTNPSAGEPVDGTNGLGADKPSVARRIAHVRLLRNNLPAAARGTIAGSDGKAYGPTGAPIRKTKRDEPYFYADDVFDVALPPGRVHMHFSGGLETVPQT
jgi:hypothetical protein